MDLEPSDVQGAIRDGVVRFLSKASSPEQVRAAEPRGWDPAVWAGLEAMGIPAMGVSEAAGGGGSSVGDLAVVAEQVGAHLASAPVVETMVAARLLERVGPAGDVWLQRVVAGEGPVVVALRPAIDGRANLVPGGAVAVAVLALDGDDLVLVEPHGDRPAPANLGSSPLADIDVAGADRLVLASGDVAHSAYRDALDEWRALAAVALVGLGRAGFGLGVTYAKERQQFGVPIGSFQAVQHRLADLATNLDGAWLLAHKAAWALDTGDDAAPKLASMAFSFAGETVQESVGYALHLHGGYGFMEEYDIQLYFRRAKAARLVLGDPRRELQGLADRLFGAVSTSDGEIG